MTERNKDIEQQIGSGADDATDRVLDAHLAALPREAHPRTDLWPAIALRLKPAGQRESRRPVWLVPAALAAGILLAVVAGRFVFEAGLTPDETPLADTSAGGDDVMPTIEVSDGDSSVNFSFSQLSALRVAGMLDQEYAGAVHEFRQFAGRTINANLNRLPQATVAEIEVAFWQFENAASEIRAALQQDPENLALAQMLATNHDRQLRLLRQVASMTV